MSATPPARGTVEAGNTAEQRVAEASKRNSGQLVFEGVVALDGVAQKISGSLDKANTARVVDRMGPWKAGAAAVSN